MALALAIGDRAAHQVAVAAVEVADLGATGHPLDVGGGQPAADRRGRRSARPRPEPGGGSTAGRCCHDAPRDDPPPVRSTGGSSTARGRRFGGARCGSSWQPTQPRFSFGRTQRGVVEVSIGRPLRVQHVEEEGQVGGDLDEERAVRGQLDGPQDGLREGGPRERPDPQRHRVGAAGRAGVDAEDLAAVELGVDHAEMTLGSRSRARCDHLVGFDPRHQELGSSPSASA